MWAVRVPHFIEILREISTDGGWGGSQLITDSRSPVIIATFRDGTSYGKLHRDTAANTTEAGCTQADVDTARAG